MDVEEEYPGSLGKEYAYKIAIENKLIKVHNLVWFALLIYNPAATLRTIVGSVGFYGIFDTLRYILEHGEQDLDNPFWQSTFYQTGWLTQIASTWCGGDCHAVHHIWHDVPIYRMREAVALITPIMIREGVQVRTSFIALVKAYLISGEAHANRWFQDSRSKAKAGEEASQTAVNSLTGQSNSTQPHLHPPTLGCPRHGADRNHISITSA
eukprot:653117-Rhodomonas_salina.1